MTSRASSRSQAAVHARAVARAGVTGEGGQRQGAQTAVEDGAAPEGGVAQRPPTAGWQVTSTTVLVATVASSSGGPAALLPFRDGCVLGRLVDQLGRHRTQDIHVVTRPEWEEAIHEAVPGSQVHLARGVEEVFGTIARIAETEPGSVLLVKADAVMHDSALDGLLLDPRVASGILTSTSSRYHKDGTGVRLHRGRVVSAESTYHTIISPTAVFLGALKLSDDDRPALAQVARELADLCEGGLPELWEAKLAAKARSWGTGFFSRWSAQQALARELEQLDGLAPWLPDPAEIRADIAAQFRQSVLDRVEAARHDAVGLLLTGLVRSGTALNCSYLRSFFWARPLSDDEAATASLQMSAINERQVLLDSAVKASDGFFTTFFVSPYSKYLARWAARRGFTPNQVTTVSMALGIVAALAFASGSRAGLVAGAILLQVAFTTDCVDGQLARYTRTFSKLGAWLDSVFDRSKEYVVYAGLCVGAIRAGDDATIWALAGAALALQVFRHSLDFSYAAHQHQTMTEMERVPLWQADERPETLTRAWRATFGANAADDMVDDEAHEVADETTLPDETEAVAEDAAGGVPAGVAASAEGVQARSEVLRAIGRAGIRLSVLLERRSWMKWAKRSLVLPIGERFALISLTAALAGPRVTFTALLAWGSVAALYTMTGRILRSWA